MSLEYQRLKPKRFPKKSYKSSMEARYWKRFQNVPLESSKDSESMLRSDIAFCHGQVPNLMATGVSARVDIFKLTQPDNSEPDSEFSEGLKPIQRIFKFKDVVTSVALRQDGNIVLCGEKTGRIQLIELNNKFILKTYEEHMNQINSFDFRSNMKDFLVGSNDTGIKMFNILEQQSVLTLHNAHSDTIKRVRYLSSASDLILSASSDRTVKLWDLRNTSGALASVRLAHGIEDICAVGESGEMVVANGPVMSVLRVGNEGIERVAEYQAFQRPIMRVRWDPTRERLLAGGMDQQMKIFARDEDGTLKVAYKIRVPQEITSLDISSDGLHFALGLSTGSLIVKSKTLETDEQEEDEEKKLLKTALVDTFVSKAKGYKYFFRGQYAALVPEDDGVIAGQDDKKAKLQPYEKLLKSFQYREALSSAIKLGNPEVVMALIEELIERGVLERALAGRGPAEFKQVVDFIKWKLTDHRFQGLLLEVTRVLLDMYSAPLINCEETTSLISELSSLLDKEIAVSSQLKQLSGQLDLMFRMSGLLTAAK